MMNIDLFSDIDLPSIGQALLKNSDTIAVAESVTAGLLQFAFSNIPDASGFFQGGITAYNVAQKFKHLQVEPIHALTVDCVSQQVAEQMARAVCKQFGSHWGLGITGYATPTPDSGNRVFAYYTIVHNGQVKTEKRISPGEMPPPDAQLFYVKTVLSDLEILLKDFNPG